MFVMLFGFFLFVGVETGAVSMDGYNGERWTDPVKPGVVCSFVEDTLGFPDDSRCLDDK